MPRLDSIVGEWVLIEYAMILKGIKFTSCGSGTVEKLTDVEKSDLSWPERGQIERGDRECLSDLSDSTPGRGRSSLLMRCLSSPVGRLNDTSSH